MPVSDTVPSPTAYLGHVVGAEGELHRTAKIYGYFRNLAEATPRVRVQVIGRSEEGRDILLAAIADEDGIRDLDRLKAATAALADPRKTSPEAAEALIASARPIYYFNAGLHSTETGSPEMAMELAYRLAVSEQPMIQKIRSELIVLINPVSEPDGRDKAVDWFYRYLKGKTDFDSLPPVSPPYWGHYVFHDNNRDTHQQALELSRAVTRMFFDYHPTVVHDLHESIPLLQTWNGTGPFNTNLDPILLNELFAMSFAEIGALTSAGHARRLDVGLRRRLGAPTSSTRSRVNHNSIGRGYETFGNGTAETVERILRPNEERYVGPAGDEPGVVPAHAAAAEVHVVAAQQHELHGERLPGRPRLRGQERQGDAPRFLPQGLQLLAEGRQGRAVRVRHPGGPGRPAARRRHGRASCIAHGIEVGRATAPFKVAEGEFAAGTYVVRLDQPYRNYAVDLLRPRPSRPTPPTSPTTTCRGRCPSTMVSKPSGSTTPRSRTSRLSLTPLAGFRGRGHR